MIKRKFSLHVVSFENLKAILILKTKIKYNEES